MNVSAEDLARFATFGASLGGAVAFLKPFAERFFSRWLDRADREQKARDERERLDREKEMRSTAALERLAVSNEREVGVLERVDEHLLGIDKRLDRLEAHLGIPATITAIPQHAPLDARASITGEHAAQPGPPSASSAVLGTPPG